MQQGTGAAQLGDLQALQQFAEHYEYDPVGNFLSLVHRADYGSWTRHYAYREDSLLEPGKHSNRLSQTHLHGDGDRGPERYLYDANGNIVQMPHLPVLQWDFMDRLAASARQVVNGGGSETTFYQYDTAGQRVRKVTERRHGTRRNERLYIGGFEVFREYDSNGDAVALERETLHGMDDKERIGLVETLTRDHAQSLPAPEPVLRYQFANHLGSATLELDEAARLISYEEYAPYGETVYQAGHHAAEVQRKRYRYTGKERDEENGFTYHGARYYAPWLGSWTSTDPVGIADGTNAYQFARRNPVRFVDPAGTDTKHPEMVKARPGYTVRNNPEKMFLENANARANWNRAVDETLENEFHLGSRDQNLAAYEKKIDSLGDGPQQISKRLNLNSKSGYARSILNKIKPRFYRAEAAQPSWDYSPEQIDVLKQGKAPDPLQQIEHLENLADNPKGALDKVYFTEGGPKGGIPKDSPHGQKNWGEPGQRLAEFQKRNAVPPDPTTPAAEPAAEPSGGVRLRSGIGTGVGLALNAIFIFQIARDLKVQQYSSRPTTFEDHLGTFIVERYWQGLWGVIRLSPWEYRKTYVGGPNPRIVGYTEELSKSEYNRFKEESDRKYGYLDWKGDYVPGTEQTAPLQDIQ